MIAKRERSASISTEDRHMNNCRKNVSGTRSVPDTLITRHLFLGRPERAELLQLNVLSHPLEPVKKGLT
jgi:hypothetical protein